MPSPQQRINHRFTALFPPNFDWRNVFVRFSFIFVNFFLARGFRQRSYRKKSRGFFVGFSIDRLSATGTTVLTARYFAEGAANREKILLAGIPKNRDAEAGETSAI
ncbi:MAG: hypothetical protein ACYDBT_00745 [Desulfobulbaceae bacterium]